MTFELAISTMHKSSDEIIKMLDALHVASDCIIINQCDVNECYRISYNDHRITCIFTTERGLSRSRNMAIRESTADIIAFADDDLVYYDGYEKTILSAFKKNHLADIIIFNMDDYTKNFPQCKKKPSFFNLFGFISMQVVFKRASILDREIWLNNYFGSGSGYFPNGEENIFLTECWKNGLTILYIPEKILKREEAESTWFKGFCDPKYISSKGAIFYAIAPHLVYLLILQFAIRKRKILQPVSFWKSIKYMLGGMKEYKELLRNE